MSEPPQKKQKTDGNLDFVDPTVVEAAKDIEAWISERRKNWPTRERTLKRKLEIAKAAKQNNLNEANNIEPSNPRSMPPCKFFRRGKCRQGSNCKYSHEKPKEFTSQARTGQPNQNNNNNNNKRIYKRFEPPPRNALFVKLVQSDHDKEDEHLLDFILFLNKSNRI